MILQRLGESLRRDSGYMDVIQGIDRMKYGEYVKRIKWMKEEFAAGRISVGRFQEFAQEMTRIVSDTLKF